MGKQIYSFTEMDCFPLALLFLSKWIKAVQNCKLRHFKTLLTTQLLMVFVKKQEETSIENAK